MTDLDVAPGDEVVILGEQGEDRIDAVEVAGWLGTTPHEVLCRTGQRIARVFGAPNGGRTG